jgi:Dynamin family
LLAGRLSALISVVAQLLGTTKKIVAKDSKSFAQEIANYIDSKDQKRGDKKKVKAKVKAKTRDKAPSLMEIMQGDKGKKKESPEGPAFWPLIRQVNVRCNSPALTTGAVLVDLPGVADANAARNSIAKDYMKKCNCIWILAPITRAVDDKTAKGMSCASVEMNEPLNY